MRQIPNWENIEENGEFNKLKPGGYVALIKNIEDKPSQEYLKISYDIAEGEFKGYYMDLYNSQNFWGGSFFRSYKESAASFFKGFITAVEKSNPGFKWNWNEQLLKGKLVGVVLQEEEYIPTEGSHAGELRTRLIVSDIHSVDKIRKGDFKVKDKKTLANKSTTTSAPSNTQDTFSTFNIDEDDIQF